MAGRRRTKTEPAGASANNSLTEDDPELVAENNKDESEKNGAGQASTSSTTGMAQIMSVVSHQILTNVLQSLPY